VDLDGIVEWLDQRTRSLPLYLQAAEETYIPLSLIILFVHFSESLVVLLFRERHFRENRLIFLDNPFANIQGHTCHLPTHYFVRIHYIIFVVLRIGHKPSPGVEKLVN